MTINNLIIRELTLIDGIKIEKTFKDESCVKMVEQKNKGLS